jgi:1-acyl-sn-glycerol-3-phosphate acyltransferase
MAGDGRSELNAWWRAGTPVAGAVFRTFFRMRYVGVQNVPRTGPAVLAANHLSALDGIVLALAPAERRRRLTRFLSPTEFFENPWYGWGLRLFGQIELKRGNPQALDEALETIRRGAMTGLFPEGRVGETGELQRGHSGVSRIALGTGAPVVPVGIWGTQARWPRPGFTLRRPWRPTLVLSFGPPIPPEGDVKNRADLRAFTKLVMEGIAVQLDLARALAEADR